MTPFWVDASLLLFILDLRRRQNFLWGWRVRRRNFGPLPLGVGGFCRQFLATPLGHIQKYGLRQFIYGHPFSLYMAMVMYLFQPVRYGWISAGRGSLTGALGGQERAKEGHIRAN